MVLLAMCSSELARAQAIEAVDRSALRVCADPSAMPFSSQDERGFENRIASLFAKDLGVPVRYTWFPSVMGFYRRTLNIRRCDIIMGAPADSEMAQSTKPYYRSTFVMLTRSADQLTLASLDDPLLKTKRIGVQARTPVVDLIARYGLVDQAQSYDLMVDSRITSVGSQMGSDLLAGKIDVAVIWGPVAAYQTRLHPDALKMTALGEAEDGVQLAYPIAMAVRRGEPRWRGRVEEFLDSRAREITQIVEDAGVPLLPLDRDQP